jgi:hypothetical protein
MIQTFERLSAEQKKALKKGVIQVTGKSMNRTALGVVAAIFELKPSITFEELKQMLPDKINPSAPKNYKSLFAPYSNRAYGVVQPGSIRQECEAQSLDVSASHFIEPNETFQTSDGVEVLVSRSWESADTLTKEHDLQNLINHVAQYGIKVVQVEKAQDFNKGDYHLEVINPELLTILQKPQSSVLKWIIIGLIAVTIGIGAYLMTK